MLVNFLKIFNYSRLISQKVDKNASGDPMARVCGEEEIEKVRSEGDTPLRKSR